MKSLGRRWAPVLLTLVTLVATACNGAATPATTSDGVATTTTQPSATTSDPAVTTTEAPETTTTTAGSVMDDTEGSGCTPGPGDLPDGTWFGYVVSSDAEVIEFDLACWFTGEAAAKAAAEDGEESPPPNDYYVRNANQTIRTLSVADDAEVDWYPNLGDPASEDTIDYLDWVTAIIDRGFMPGIWVEVSDGQVTRISEQWVP